MQIGLAIRAARKKSGLTQAEVAERAKLEKNYICKLENGLHEPNLETLSRIGDAIGIEGWKIYRFAMKPKVPSVTCSVDSSLTHPHPMPSCAVERVE